VSATGIRPNPDKVRAVREFRVPTNVKMVREFLGLAGYYRKFIPNFARVARALHDSPNRVPHLCGQLCVRKLLTLLRIG